ncbi:MAG: WbqC family protein [Solirubrobacteraceae bacterium]
MASPKTVAIVQSNYVPWKGYFDLMAAVDELILLDEVQYTRRDWRNRNRFKAPGEVRWLTIPVQVADRYLQRIEETLVSDRQWAQKHWATLRNWYGRADAFEQYAPLLEELYLGLDETYLSQINRRFLETVRDILGLTTALTWSRDYRSSGRRTDRLVSICRSAGATCYVSGPLARSYLEETSFHDAGIDVRWMTYDGYPEYPQLYPPFEHRVSILDLILNVGDEARSYMLTEVSV